MLSSDSETDSISSALSDELSVMAEVNGSGDGRRTEEKKKLRSFKLTRMPSLRSNASQDTVVTGQRLPCVAASCGYAAGSEQTTPMEMSDTSPDYAESASSSDETEERSQVQARTLARRLSVKRLKTMTRVSSRKIGRALLMKVSGGANTKTRSKERSTEIAISDSLKMPEKDSGIGEDQFSSHSSYNDASSPPRYLKPTSSSASKEVRVKKSVQNSEINSNSNQNRRNRKMTFRGLTRTSSLRLARVVSLRSKRSWVQDPSILRPTCSSALKGSKHPDQTNEENKSENNSTKVCPYTYCSLHGHRHANVPPLKRFVSMRKRLLKTQKTLKPGSRPSTTLKRSGVKTKRKQWVNVGNASETANGILIVGSSNYCLGLKSDQEQADDCLVPDNSVGKQVIESMKTRTSQKFKIDTAEQPLSEACDTDEKQENASAFVPQGDFSADDHSKSRDSRLEVLELSEECENEPNQVIMGSQKNVTSDGNFNQGIKEESISTLECITHRSDSEPYTKQPKAILLHAISTRKQLQELHSESEPKKRNSGDEYRFSQGFPLRGGSANATISDVKHVKIWNIIYQNMVTDLGSEAETSQSLDEGKNTEDDAVKLVQQAFDEILSEIPDQSSDNQLTAGEAILDLETVEDREMDDSGQSIFTGTDSEMPGKVQGIAEMKRQSEECITTNTEKPEPKNGNKSDKQTPKKWSYLKKVLLLKRFFNALEKVRSVNPRRPQNLSSEPDTEAEKVHLRHCTAEERKKGEDWMLDYVLRRVVSTLALSQRKKVILLVKAFEAVIPTDNAGALSKSYTPASSPETPVQACTVSSLESNVESGKDNTSEISVDGLLCSATYMEEDEDKVTGLCDAKRASEDCLQDVECRKRVDSLSSTFDETGCIDCEDSQADAVSKPQDNQASPLDTDSHKSPSEQNVVEKEVGPLANVTDETTHKSARMTSDEIVGSIVTSNIAELGSACESSQESNTDRILAENHNLIGLRNLIYKHMVTGLRAEAETPTGIRQQEREEVKKPLDTRNSSHYSQGPTALEELICMKEEKDYDADCEYVQFSTSVAVKLVQQAFDQILSDIPDQSSGDQSVQIWIPPDPQLLGSINGKGNFPEDPSLEAEIKYKSNGNIHMKWSNLRKVILLKRFVGALEKVRNFTPRKPRHLKLKPDPESEQIHLRHLLVEDKPNAEEWMLDYALGQVISTLTPSDRRKVAHLVQAFDTILKLQDIGAHLRFPVAGSLHDLVNSSSISPSERCDETGKVSTWALLSDRTPSPKIVKFPAEEESKSVNLVLPTTGESSQRDISSLECSGPPTWSSDETEENMGKEKNIWLWQMIHRHMVTGLSENKTPEVQNGLVVDTEDKNHDAGSQRSETSKSDAVKFVQQAFDRILSEIPDKFSEDESVDYGITSEHAVPKNDHGEHREACIPTSSESAITFVVQNPNEMQLKANCAITSEQKQESNMGNIGNQKTSKSWSNLKKMILLRRFVKTLEALTSFSPRKPQYLPMEPESDPEKIRLRHLSMEEKKNSEEWMLDYALQQVISTLAPSQKRKVALLAQAFDTVSMGSDTASSHMPLWSGSSSPIQRGDRTHAEYIYSHLLDRAESVRCQAESVQMNATKSLDDTSDSCFAEENTFPEIKVAGGEVGDRKSPKCVSASENVNRDSIQDEISIIGHGKGTGDSHSAYTQDEQTNFHARVAEEPRMSDKKIQTDPELLYELLREANPDVQLRANGDTAENNTKHLESGNSTLDVRESDKSGSPQEDCEMELRPECRPSQRSLREKESAAVDAHNAGHSGKVESQKYMSLWGLISKHMTAASEEQTLSEETAKGEDKLLVKNDTDSHVVVVGKENHINKETNGSEEESINQYREYHNEAIKLMEEAIDEISLPESPDGSCNGQSMSGDVTPKEELVLERDNEEETPIGSLSSKDLETMSAGMKDHDGRKVTQKSETERKPKPGKNWNNLKKIIILKRFAKAVEKVRQFNPGEPRYLAPVSDPEAEKVNLKHHDLGGRKDGEEWMLDSALRGVVAQLTPARKRKVQLLVEAFESVGCK